MIAIAIAVIIIFVICSKWSSHVEDSVKRIEGQIKRAEERDTPPDQK